MLLAGATALCSRSIDSDEDVINAFLADGWQAHPDGDTPKDYLRYSDAVIAFIKQVEDEYLIVIFDKLSNQVISAMAVIDTKGTVVAYIETIDEYPSTHEAYKVLQEEIKTSMPEYGRYLP